MKKKASLEDYLNVTQIKREDTDAYLRYLTKWHDHHDAQMNPSYPVKFAHTRADAGVDMEKVAFLGGLARGIGSAVGKGGAMAGRAAAGASNAAGRVVGGGARMANAASNRVAGARNNLSQWAANKRQSASGFKSNMRGAYNQGRHGSVHGNAAAFEAATLKANPNLGNAARKPFQAVGKPTLAPPSSNAGNRFSSGLNKAKDAFGKMSPRAQKAAKIGGAAAGAYGSYKVGQGIYNKVKDSRRPEYDDRY